MTDQELLEMAAKAAGIKALCDPNGVWRNCTGFDPAMNIFAGGPWIPLTDDGDALRLAVKLRLQVTCGWDNPTLVEVSWISLRNDGAWTMRTIESDQIGSLEENTRRAIVRAAAEIGKHMMESGK